ncbi:MAG: hypothetical protein OSB69_01740 [Alphaproteobacteria bacterium]|nr:hypothetical protein [Alphaproteobacteria bacterium]
MFLEALTYLTTPCPPLARRLGFLREMVSIISRHGRCRKAWAPHLTRSQATVRQAIEQSAGSRRAVVLGAGLGYDLPLADLIEHFDQVLLVDLVHGPAIRLAAWRSRRVRLVSHDVTECLENLIAGQLDVAEPSRFLDDPAVDLVVSLNIVSQLPTLPGHFLENAAGRDEAEADAIGCALVGAHFRYLEKFNATVCLVGDIAREVLAPNGTVVETVSALRGATIPWAGETWSWDIAPLGEEGSGYAIRNRVIGIPSISEAAPVA